MRALQVHALTGPDGVAVGDAPEPEAADGLVLVDVRAAGVSFVDLLLSRGGYQIKLDPRTRARRASCAKRSPRSRRVPGSSKRPC